MPDKHFLPEWVLTMLAGIIGASLRQLSSHRKTWFERLTEWLVGGAMAVFASPTVAQIIHHLLLKWDMIALDAELRPINIIGLAGFICGAVGVSTMEAFTIWLRKWLMIKKD